MASSGSGAGLAVGTTGVSIRRIQPHWASGDIRLPLLSRCEKEQHRPQHYRRRTRAASPRLRGARDARLTIGKTVGQRVLAEGGQGLALELADSFQRHPEPLPELFERPWVVGIKAETPPHDGP